jgi:predicted alpha/beta hydrolase family esterase
MKTDILHVGGGLSFADEEQMLAFYKNFDIDEQWGERNWKRWLEWTLSDRCNFLEMKRPTGDNANYEVWKIIFEKYFPKLLGEQTILIGHSLGTIFLMKYLVENGFQKKIKQLHLVASIVSNDFQPADDPENTGTFTFDILQVHKLEDVCEEIHIWHSEDDTMCSIKNAEYLKEQIPKSVLHSFTDKGHFLQATFLELFDVIRA